jgi:hypothetical protein
VSRRALLTVATFVAALFSAAMPSHGRSAPQDLGGEAVLRVDRLVEHAAPWQVGIAPSVPVAQSVREGQQYAGGTGVLHAAIWTTAAATHATSRTHAPPAAAFSAPRSVRHRVGFDATAPPHTPHRVA